MQLNAELSHEFCFIRTLPVQQCLQYIWCLFEQCRSMKFVFDPLQLFFWCRPSSTGSCPSAKRSLMLPNHSTPFKKVRPTLDYGGWNKPRPSTLAQPQPPLQGLVPLMYGHPNVCESLLCIYRVCLYKTQILQPWEYMLHERHPPVAF